MKIKRVIRGILRGSPVAEAANLEEHVLNGELTRRRRHAESVSAAYCSGGPELPSLGTLVGSKAAVRIPAKRQLGHILIVGPTGAGKSYLAVSWVLSLLMGGIKSLVALDPKLETLLLLQRALLRWSKQLGGAGTELLEKIVWIDPFSGSSLPALQILLGEPGASVEALAYEVALVITNGLSMGVGVRQEGVLFIAIQALVILGLPITALARVLVDPTILDRLAEGDRSSTIIRMAAERIRGESRERIAGLVARVEALLRLRETRLALGAPSCIDFDRLLNERLGLINLSPREGTDDVARMLRDLIWIKLTRAIRRRPNGSPPMLVLIDEAPSFLSGGGPQVAARVEELLRIARSKGVYFAILSQDMEAIANVSPSLPGTLRTNVSWIAVFRSREDWDSILPITGCRPKERGPAWEEHRGGYMERAAEKKMLCEQLKHLPDRHVLLVDNRSGVPGVFMRTAELELYVPPAELEALEAHARNNDLVLPMTTLEATARRVEERLRGTLAVDDGREPPVVLKPKRGRPPVGMG